MVNEWRENVKLTRNVSIPLYSGFKFLGPTSIAAIACLTTPDKFGREVGILEISFALAPLVGYPIVGELLERFGWRGPFDFLSVSCAFILHWMYVSFSILCVLSTTPLTQ